MLYMVTCKEHGLPYVVGIYARFDRAMDCAKRLSVGETVAYVTEMSEDWVRRVQIGAWYI